MHIVQRDLKHIWHPCSQMKDYEQFPPMQIKRAYGPYIELSDGRKLIDAISSWWCKSLGHGHPQLQQALKQQLEQFEHVIFANTTYETIVQLSEKLAGLTETLCKVFYASDGSCAVEIALKMSLHARQITGDLQRTEFMALEHGYHGETALALSVSDLGIYRTAYQHLLPDTLKLIGIPYVCNRQDPLWHDCSDYWPAIEAQLMPHQETLTAIIIEPIVQGAGGMKIYSADFLKRLRLWTKLHGIHLIADEIMTGLGRTGKSLACHHADIEPDFLCLGKGLTSGFLPLSAMLTSNTIYQLFYDDYYKGKSFLHSHTHSGNALAASVALACLTVMETENINQRTFDRESGLANLMQQVSDETGDLCHLRSIGGIVAADLINRNNSARLGYQVYQQACQLGALLRPLGNTIYWLPPLNCDHEVLVNLQRITRQAIQHTVANNQ